MKTIIGIDPGMKGGLAFLDDDGVMAYALPMVGGEINYSKLISLLVDPLDNTDTYLAVIEKVHAMPKQGVSSTFKFGRQYGEIRGILIALNIPMIEVTPQAWKKKVLAGQDWKGNKKASVQFCQKRWPKVSLLPKERSRVPSDGMADAICIAMSALN